MTKLKLIEQENEEVVNEVIPEESIDTSELEDTPEQSSFIDSDQLNELRDIILDIPDDISILLLNDDLIVLASVDSDETYLYSLPEDSEELVLTPMGLDIDEIKADNDIIKYEPEKVDPRHDKVVELLMKKLEDFTEEVEHNEED